MEHYGFGNTRTTLKPEEMFRILGEMREPVDFIQIRDFQIMRCMYMSRGTEWKVAIMNLEMQRCCESYFPPAQ